MVKRVVTVAIILVAFATVYAQARNASQSLINTLATLRNLSSSSFQQVVWWAPNPSRPSISIPDWNAAEQQIMDLGGADRNAVLSWLRGNGRSELYDRGATDAMIGPRRSQIDGTYTPATPSPQQQYRTLQLTSEQLKGSAPPASGIVVNRGFALIKRDATKAIVCLSFTNTKPVAATSIQFAFPLVDDLGDTVGTLQLTRTGTFSQNIAIDGPADANTYFNPGFGPRSQFDNCLVSDQGTAALPLRQTRFVTYRVTAVQFADGSSWP